MTKFLISYELHGHVYQSEVRTSTSGAAMDWVKNTMPDATNIKIV